MSLTALFDEPKHVHGPDAQRCSAAENPEAWAVLTTGWSQVVGAARTIQSRHAADSGEHVLSMCADSAREAAVSELRWAWARLVNKYVEAVSADV
ncbi:hypothetical protein AOT83_19085 [Mycobacteroides sp. H001]|nr:hypothetical protein AOT86_11365 [Mycobacteroides sp. H072]KRQ32724.1 hypothetical protein AOT84_20635 [Mycobacteroides sp. H002]KRQ54149.1 hypothetical protein AOT85_05135 [Mycobacteroides sp. H054]KRQ68110.1 hypothetical protein AOT83_19085 [Mycobacteroides sp. H001]